VFFSERSLIETGNQPRYETIDYLAPRAMFTKGPPAPPKGARRWRYEDRSRRVRATPMATTWIVPVKSDGSYTYFASDIANHKNRVRPRL